MRKLLILLITSLAFSTPGIEWQYVSYDDGVGLSVVQISDGSYIIGNNAGKLIKIDSDGNEVWTQHDGYGDIYSIDNTIDGGAIFVKEDELIKINSNGDVEWTQNLGFEGRSVIQITDEHYICTGDSLLNKIDSNGDVLWSNSLGHSNLLAVKETDDGGFIVTGYDNYGSSTGPIAFLVKTDSNGNIEWDNQYLSMGRGEAIIQTNDNGYIFDFYFF